MVVSRSRGMEVEERVESNSSAWKSKSPNSSSRPETRVEVGMATLLLLAVLKVVVVMVRESMGMSFFLVRRSWTEVAPTADLRARVSAWMGTSRLMVLSGLVDWML